MVGMTLSEFIDKVYYGEEIEFKVGDVTYFIQGYKKDEQYYLTVDYWNKTDGTEPAHDYLFSKSYHSPDERKSQFEEAKIFDGKTIYEVEQDVIVLFG